MSLFLLAIITVVSVQNGRMYRTMLRTQIQDNTLEIAKKAATGSEALLETWAGLLHVTMHLLGNTGSANAEKVFRSILSSNKEVIGLHVLSRVKGKEPRIIVEQLSGAQEDHRLEGKSLTTQAALIRKRIQNRVRATKPQDRYFVENISDVVGVPALSLGFRFNSEKGTEQSWGVLTLWQERLTGLLSQDANTRAYVVLENGQYLLSSDRAEIMTTRLSPVFEDVRDLFKSTSPYVLKEVKNLKSQTLLAAFHKIQKYNLAVVVERNTQAEYSNLNMQIVRTALFAWILLLVAVLLAYFASGNITKDLQNLAAATLRIASGDFSVRLVPRSRDEVGVLSLTVNHLAGRIVDLLVRQIETTRLEHELKTAQVVQNTLFPQAKIQTEMLTVSGFYQPASECGGDWWTHQVMGDGRELVCVGDATGHGAAAALVVALCFASCKSFCERAATSHPEELTPGKLLEQMNRIFWSAGRGKTSMTMFVVIIDPQTGRLTYANSGHNAPFILLQNSHSDEETTMSAPEGAPAKKRTKNCVPLICPGTPLGYGPDSIYRDKEAHVHPTDKLFLYTDGLIECESPAREPFGKKRLTSCLEKARSWSAEKVQHFVWQHAFQHFENHPLADDVTVVVVEISANWRPRFDATPSQKELNPSPNQRVFESSEAG